MEGFLSAGSLIRKDFMTVTITTSLNYNCDKVESKEGGLRMDEVENKDLRER